MIALGTGMAVLCGAILALLVTLITFRQGGDADLAPATN